jgi:hypothetical protein
MKLFNWAVDASQPLPPDRLRAWQLARGGAALHATSGVPSSADCCAYEPTQRLLAVRGARGCGQRHSMHRAGRRASSQASRLRDRMRNWRPPGRDGGSPRRAQNAPCAAASQVSTADARIKLFGREGVERTLFCAPGGGGADGPPPATTRHLAFLANRGAVLRVDTVRDWSTMQQGQLRSAPCASAAGSVNQECAVVAAIAGGRPSPRLVSRCERPPPV